MNKKSIIFSTCLITLTLALYFFSQDFTNQKKQIENAYVEKHTLSYNIIIDRLQKQTDKIFNLLLNKDGVKELFKNQKREELYSYLEKDFSTIKNGGYNVIHFHLPNNHSFLRMHNKEKFGDDLSQIRYGISFVNTHKVATSGLEIGRSLTAYRFIYPLFYNEEYLGSVELAYSMKNIIDEMEKYYKIHGHVLIKKDLINEKKLFSEVYDKFFEDSLENNNYAKLKSKDVEHPVNLKHLYKTFEKIKKNIDNQMLLNKPFVQNVKDEEHFILTHKDKPHYSAVFIPLKNIQNKIIGYNTFYVNDKELINIEHHYYMMCIVALLFISFIFYYIYTRSKFTDNLKKAVEEKTNELQQSVRQVEEMNDDLEEANKELEKQKALYNIVFEDSLDGISVINIHENLFVECNDRFLKMLNARSKDEVLNMQPSDLSPEFQPDGQTSFAKATKMIQTAIKKGNHLFEWMHKKITGEDFWVEVSLTHFVLNGKEMLYVIWKDIDEKKKIEEKNIELQRKTTRMNALLTLQTTDLENHKKLLQQKVNEQTKELLEQNEILSIHKAELQAQNDELNKTQEQLRKTSSELENLFNGTPYPIVLVNHNLEIKTHNAKFSIVFMEKNVYQSNPSLMYFTSKESHIDLIDCFNHISLDIREYIIKMKTSKGERRFKLKMDVHPEESDLIIVSLIDVEDELLLQDKIKEQDKQVMNQSKMAALGDMIGNIAHQWRQPLNAISVSATGLKVQHDIGNLNEESINKYIPVIVSNVDYLSNTIETFRNFVKNDKELKETTIQEEVNLGIEIVKSSLQNNHIELRNKIDYDHPISNKMVTKELAEVIINILNNSKDVIKERNIKDGWIELNLIKEEKYATITIEDNGQGIKEEIINRIFEPYFTTKHKAQGTGLGLHMSYRIIVESMKGNLYVKNTQNGAKFFIEIPLNK